MVRRALKRLLANGRLTALPKRPADQELLVAMAASRIEAHRSFHEREVNERLRSWLETISAPIKIVMCLFLVGWALNHAGGFGDMMSMPSQNSCPD